jgi:AcrR family transcriptional regulator
MPVSSSSVPGVYRGLDLSRQPDGTPSDRRGVVGLYADVVPKLWTETIEGHRREVREAILDAAWTLVTAHGLLSVTMSQIAQEAGIGRATLYKYFPDVETVLHAWHDRQVSRHLTELAAVRDQTAGVSGRLEAVLQGYALISHRRARHDSELAAMLHSSHAGEHGAHARERLHLLVRDLISDGVRDGDLRDDVSADELATYCLHALQAAGALPSEAAVRRLVAVTLAGLHRRG